MADNILTRKFGGVPGWAIGGGAILAGLAFFYFRGKSTQQAQAQSSDGSLVNNPAASTVPYVPSVTVTGIPTAGSTSPGPTTTNQGPPPAVWQFGPNPAQPYVWKVTAQGLSSAQSRGIQIPNQVSPGPLTQDILNLTGPYGTQWSLVPSGNDSSGNPWNPQTYAAALNGTGGGGRGGWGQAGTTNPIAFMSWNSGWTPLGGGSPGTILSQRAGIKTAGSGGRFDYGGAGGKGATGSANRRSASGLKPPIKRRYFSGRR